MSRFRRREINECIQRVRAAAGATERGHALEELVCHLFASIPGILAPVRNVVDFADGGEIDIFFANKAVDAGLWFLPISLLSECKNWTRPVGAEEVRVFIDRLRERACRAGIMIAAHGLTGDNGDLSAARRHIARALEQDVEVLVLTLDDLEHVNSSAELVKLLLDKWIRLKSFLSSI
jgi:restriction endonuclease